MADGNIDCLVSAEFLVVITKMNPAQNGYCRLCGEQKRSEEVINLLGDSTAREDIWRKLDRINSSVDFYCDYLPMAVCFVCANNLQSAFEFVCNIAKAQVNLSRILGANVKEEAEAAVDCNENSSEFAWESVETKLEVGESSSSSTSFCSPLIRSAEKNKNEVVKPNVEIPKNDDKPKKRTRGRPKKSKSLEICNADDEPEKRTCGRPKKSESPKKSVKKSKKKKNKPPPEPKMTWKDYSWSCSYCDTEFATIGELRNHSIQAHEACNAYRCTVCRIRKSSIQKYLQHARSHNKELKYSCYICFQTFGNQTEKDTHRRSHLNSKYICKGCFTVFDNETDLEIHTKSSFKYVMPHPTKDLKQRYTKDLTCLLCQKTLSNRNSLRAHLLLHTDAPKNHVCETCGKSFSVKNNLIYHMETHNDEHTYKCQICELTFKTIRKLREHVKFVHENKEPYKCQHCERTFQLRKNLTYHMRVHSDEMPFSCPYCVKAFRWKTSLNLHLRQHTGVKPYSCDVCQRDFTNSGNYNLHMKSRHGIDTRKRKTNPDAVVTEFTPETEEMIEWKRQLLQRQKRTKECVPDRINLVDIGESVQSEPL